jgi:hypothetical protein
MPAAVWWELHDLPVQLLPAGLYQQTVQLIGRFLWDLRLPVRRVLRVVSGRLTAFAVPDRRACAAAAVPVVARIP